MKSKIILFVLLMVLVASCKKKDPDPIPEPKPDPGSTKTLGSLVYKIVDDQGKGMRGIIVTMYRDDFKTFMQNRTTDENGLVNFGVLDPVGYAIAIDSPTVNNIKYSPRERVKIVAGKDTKRELKVSDFSGTHTINVISDDINADAKDINVFLIPPNKYPYLTLTSVQKLAEFNSTTNSQGSVSFKIPSNKSYRVILYNTATKKILNDYGNEEFTVGKDSTQSVTLHIKNYSSTGTYNITVMAAYGYLHPFKDNSVYLIAADKYSSKGYKKIGDVARVAEFNDLTNADGNVSFRIPSDKLYKAIFTIQIMGL